jgi:hypothetical protein
MSKQLFLVTITQEAYAWADSEDAAEECADEICKYETPTVLVTRVKGNPLGWSKECLVYSDTDEDITLGSVA